MSARWSYLTLTWVLTITKTGDAVTRDSRWLIRGHDGTESTRPGTDVLVDILGDLGGDGWELVSEAVQSTTVEAAQGYNGATTPMRVRWILKRPAD